MGKTRNKKVTIRLTESEYQTLKNKSQHLQMKMEPFLRKLICDDRIIEKPIEEWSSILRQISGVSTNVNQIAKKVNCGNPVLFEELTLVEDMLSQIWEKVKKI